MAALAALFLRECVLLVLMSHDEGLSYVYLKSRIIMGVDCL
jgi:hypothetical protein